MTKIVARMIVLGVAGNPIPAKPKTMYLAGEKYARIEEEPDAKAGSHTLIVTNEPDNWIINLADKTGRHLWIPGRSLSPMRRSSGQRADNRSRISSDLEFGAEMKFFGEGRALELKPRTIERQKCKALSIKTGPHEAILLLDPRTGKPFQIDLIKFERLVSSVRYRSYETDLPFKALFVSAAERRPDHELISALLF